VRRIADLEEMVKEMRSNQVAKVTFGDIVLDGTGVTGTLSTSGGTIIDNSGLNSLANFPKGQIINASSPSTSSGTYIDVPGSTMSPFTLGRSTNVLIYFSIDGNSGSFPDCFCNVQYVDNTTQLQDLFVTGNFTTEVTGGVATYAVDAEFAYFMQFVTLSAGSHTFKLQMKADGAGSTAYLTNWLIGYIIFGS
jgi:hypothetical protein